MITCPYCHRRHGTRSIGPLAVAQCPPKRRPLLEQIAGPPGAQRIEVHVIPPAPEVRIIPVPVEPRHRVRW